MPLTMEYWRAEIAAAQPAPVVREELTFRQGDRVYTPTEIVDQSGSRLHRLQGDSGLLEVRYEAVIDGFFAPAPSPAKEGGAA